MPKNVVMLTADAFGVLPPIAKLTPAQAMYHFLSGYTARVAGTEKGLGKEPQATFSTCFGAPFLPRHPEVYGRMLRRADRAARRRLLAGQHRLDRRRLWHRQAHVDQAHPRAAARRAGWRLAKVEFVRDPFFGLMIPKARAGHPGRGAEPARGLGRQGRL